MGHLVDDLLNLAKIGRRDLARQRTNLDLLVREALADLPGTENRSVEWRVEPLPEVDCDPGLLKLVFNNLLGNALKFTRDRQPAIIEIGTSDSAGPTTILVRDNVWDSIPNMPISFLESSSDFIARKISRARALAWPPFNELFASTEAKSGPNPQ
jgi:signal transduction histidine kinase